MGRDVETTQVGKAILNVFHSGINFSSKNLLIFYRVLLDSTLNASIRVSNSMVNDGKQQFN